MAAGHGKPDPFWVQVDCDAAGEPIGVHVGGGRRRVEEVLDRWDHDGRSDDEDGGDVRRILKVRLEDGEVVMLEQDVGTRAWTLRAAGLGR